MHLLGYSMILRSKAERQRGWQDHGGTWVVGQPQIPVCALNPCPLPKACLAQGGSGASEAAAAPLICEHKGAAAPPLWSKQTWGEAGRARWRWALGWHRPHVAVLWGAVVTSPH